MSEEVVSQRGGRPENESGSVDLLRGLSILIRHRFLIVRTVATFVVLAVVIALAIPNKYTAETKLMAPQQRDSMANSLAGALAGLGALRDFKGISSSALSFSDPNAPFIGVMQSNTVADHIIARFKLKDVYKKDSQVALRKALAGATQIKSTKDQGISIAVTDADPRRAADMANAYVEEFRNVTDSMAMTEAAQRRMYFERELGAMQNQLAIAEAALKETEEKTGLLNAGAQAGATFEGAMTLKAQIAEEEAAISGMSTYATAQNNDVIVAKDQLASLRSELAKLKHNTGRDDPMVAEDDLPKAAIDQMRRVRDVMHYEELYKFLTAQYEAARADEGREAVLVQVLDVAQPPEHKSKPHRALIVLMGGLLGFMFSGLVILLKLHLENLRQDPQRLEQLDSMVEALRPRGWKGLFRLVAGKGI